MQDRHRQSTNIFHLVRVYILERPNVRNTMLHRAHRAPQHTSKQPRGLIVVCGTRLPETKSRAEPRQVETRILEYR
jgi:hypothetical protein